MSDLSELEIDAVVFRVIRSNQDRVKSAILRMIKEELSGVTSEMIALSLQRLGKL